MKPRAWDQNAQEAWQQLLAAPQTLPVSFTYGENTYHGFDGLRELSRTGTATEQRESLTVTYALDENVTVRLEAAYWPRWGAREWTVYFTNTGTENSAVLRNVVSADLHLAGGDPLVRGILGDHDNLYHPYCHTLAAQPLQLQVHSRPLLPESFSPWRFFSSTFPWEACFLCSCPQCRPR